jgi:hypothetical protein
VKITDIKFGPDEYEPDPIYSKFFTEFDNGRIPIGHTRISIPRITPGFLKHNSEGKLDFIQDPLNEDHVKYLARIIQAGSRSPIFIYNSTFAMIASKRRRSKCLPKHKQASLMLEPGHYTTFDSR